MNLLGCTWAGISARERLRAHPMSCIQTQCPSSPLPTASASSVPAALCRSVYAGESLGQPLITWWPPSSPPQRGHVLVGLLPILCSHLAVGSKPHRYCKTFLRARNRTLLEVMHRWLMSWCMLASARFQASTYTPSVLACPYLPCACACCLRAFPRSRMGVLVFVTWPLSLVWMCTLCGQCVSDLL